MLARTVGYASRTACRRNGSRKRCRFSKNSRKTADCNQPPPRLEVQELSSRCGFQRRKIHLQKPKEKSSWNTYALFFDGEYLTNERMNDTRFIKLLEK
ncbi:MAG: YoaP domain-containing protein [Clostridia bacterium]|nr:YoaP domain-containing protein [Clostridia bacterium]